MAANDTDPRDEFVLEDCIRSDDGGVVAVNDDVDSPAEVGPPGNAEFAVQDCAGPNDDNNGAELLDGKKVPWIQIKR